MTKTCCVTGHRDICEASAVYVEEELRKEIALAISEGYTHFISGFARGMDLLFARLVLEAKAEHKHITLEAAIPYRGRLKTRDMLFHSHIGKCETVSVHSETYHRGCYMIRNRYMVEKSGRVIAVYDGREEGGTFATIRYAKELKRNLRTIRI